MPAMPVASGAAGRSPATARSARPARVVRGAGAVRRARRRHVDVDVAGSCRGGGEGRVEPGFDMTQVRRVGRRERECRQQPEPVGARCRGSRSRTPWRALPGPDVGEDGRHFGAHRSSGCRQLVDTARGVVRLAAPADLRRAPRRVGRAVRRDRRVAEVVAADADTHERGGRPRADSCAGMPLPWGPVRSAVVAPPQLTSVRSRPRAWAVKVG